MPTDQLAAFDGGSRVIPAPRDGRFAPRRAFDWLAWVPSRRWRPRLRDFNDHMLADFGLSHDDRALRGRRIPDPWLLAKHLR